VLVLVRVKAHVSLGVDFAQVCSVWCVVCVCTVRNTLPSIVNDEARAVALPSLLSFVVASVSVDL